MKISPRHLIIGAGVLILAFIVAVALTIIFRNRQGKISVSGPSSSTASTLPPPLASGVPQNAFSSNSSGSLSLNNVGGGGSAAGGSDHNPTPIPSSTPWPTPVYNGKPVTTLEQVNKIVMASSSLAIGTEGGAPLISLPTVPDSELAIDPSGVSSTESYLIYFNSHYADISFNAKRFESVLKDKNGIMLFPYGLIQKALDDNNFEEVSSSLAIFKDFITAKMNFEKSMKVYGAAAIALNKQMIGFDELDLQLIQKGLDAGTGSVSKKSVNDFFQSLLATAASAHKEFLKQSGLLSLGIPPKKNWLDRVLVFLGLEKKADAQFGMPPFGGQIGLPIFCLCDFGFWVSVGPPVPPATGSLFIPISFLASPTFYLYKSLIPGSWWLGLYTPATIPCLEFVIFGCFPIGIGSMVYMAGTSIL